MKSSIELLAKSMISAGGGEEAAAMEEDRSDLKSHFVKWFHSATLISVLKLESVTSRPKRPSLTQLGRRQNLHFWKKGGKPQRRQEGDKEGGGEEGAKLLVWSKVTRLGNRAWYCQDGASFHPKKKCPCPPPFSNPEGTLPQLLFHLDGWW